MPTVRHHHLIIAVFPIDLGCNLKSFSTQHSGQQLWIDLNRWKYDTNFSVRGISEREKKRVYSGGERDCVRDERMKETFGFRKVGTKYQVSKRKWDNPKDQLSFLHHFFSK